MGIFSLIIKPLAYLSLPYLLLRTLSQSSPLARYYVRLTLYVSMLGVCSAWGAIISIPMTFIGRRFDINYVVARTFNFLAGRALGISIVVEDEDYLANRPAIFVSNHQSMLDILCLGRVLQKGCSIMGKKELQWVPLMGQFMQLSGAVFVDRGNNAAAVRSLAAAGETIRTRHTSLWMFPEGTRTLRPNADLKPFKKGAFHMAVEAGVPIIPVVCENYWRLYRKGVFEEGVLKVKVLAPISTAGMTHSDVSALAISVREKMLEALREISIVVPDPAAPTPSAPAEKPIAPPAPSVEQPQRRTAEPAPLAALPELTTAGPNVSAVPSPATAASSISIPDERSASRASTNPSDDFSSPPSTSSHSREEGSEAGVETEEDEGMVLVGRPSGSQL